MGKDVAGKTLGIIHAAAFTAATLEPFAKEIIPEVELINAVDGTVQRDNLRALVGTIPKVNFFKFATFARLLGEAGTDMIMLACSAFNRAVEYAMPMINIQCRK